MSFKYQEFNNYQNTYATAFVCSYYNDHGCFSIISIPVIGDIAFYLSPTISDKIEMLTAKQIDIRSISPHIWIKAEKKLLFKKRPKLIAKTLRSAIIDEIANKGTLLNIKI